MSHGTNDPGIPCTSPHPIVAEATFPPETRRIPVRCAKASVWVSPPPGHVPLESIDDLTPPRACPGERPPEMASCLLS